jgi:hypothetical protein
MNIVRHVDIALLSPHRYYDYRACRLTQPQQRISAYQQLITYPMKPPKRILTVVADADETSKVDSDGRPVRLKRRRAKPKPVSISMSEAEIEDLKLMVGGWQKIFIERSGGKATRLGRSDVLRAAVKKFKDMDHAEALEALLEVFPDDTSAS